MNEQPRVDRVYPTLLDPNERTSMPGKGGGYVFAAVVVVLAAALAWGIFGRIRTTVDGEGIIVRENQQVFTVEGRARGEIADIVVAVGEPVAAGQALVELRQPQLMEQIEAAQERLARLRSEFARNRASLDADLASLARPTDEHPAAGDRAGLAAAEERRPGGSVPSKDATAQRGTQTEATRLRADITVQLARWRQEIIDEELKLHVLQAKLEAVRTVPSPVDGVVGEILQNVGQTVGPQDELMTVVSGGPGFGVIAFLSAGEAPRAEPGLAVQISPATVARGEYGTMRGDVAFVSETPVSTARIRMLLRNPELSEEFASGKQPYLCMIDLVEAPQNPSGFAWWRGSGPPYSVTIGTRVTVDIVVQERAPIMLLLPALRSLVGK